MRLINNHAGRGIWIGLASSNSHVEFNTAQGLWIQNTLPMYFSNQKFLGLTFSFSPFSFPLPSEFNF